MKNRIKNDHLSQVESTIALTRRESMQLLQMLEHPKPRSKTFQAAMARYQRMRGEQDRE